MTTKDLDRFRRVEAIFDAAADSPPGAGRDALLDERCAGDTDMLNEVLRMLEDHDRVSAAVPPLPESLPQFGAWKAIRLLGRGGMGTVYLAERADGAFKMSAAVKVVPLALASVDIEERFRRERQFLASLDHPKVARLIDGGVTSSGLPYLVMEFVDGLTIERYCEVHKLDSRARIALFRQVLEALIYVHSRGVIHRDLKPSNILVDKAGDAKLLDFGTARLVDASGDASITKTGVFAFTPECASPEQVQGKTVTFASDTYSLGVLLYRLLTGRPPYRFTDYSPSAVAEHINRTEPEPSGLEKPLAAILSTALEKAPENRYASAAEMDADLARYLEGQPVHAKRPVKTPKLAMAACAAIVCAVAAVAFFNRGPSGAEASIAVLPFTSSNASEYLSSGLSDELTEALSHTKALRVIAPASVAQFKGRSVDFREAGRELQVANILEGGVDGQGDRVRLTVRLERVADGTLLWSDTFDRPASDLAAVQSEVAAKIARTLKVGATTAAEHVPSPEAHEYVLKGRYEMQQLTIEVLQQAEVDFQHAIDLDPQYALAYLYKGIQTFNLGLARGSTYRTDEERKSAEQLIRKALDLDPNLPSAHGMLALMTMQYDWNWDRAERELKQGVAAGPNPNVEQGYASLLLFRRRFTEADQHIQKLQEMDPFETTVMTNIAEMRLLEGRTGEARAMAQKVVAAYPKIFGAKAIILECDALEGRTDQALEEIRELKKSFPPAQMFEAMVYAHTGHREEALRLIRPFEEKYPNPGVPMQWFASVYGLMGDEPNTVKWLERSADRHEWQVLNMAVSPSYQSVRNSAGFRTLEKRIGLLQ